MRPPHFHDPSHLPAITCAKGLVGLQNAIVEWHRQVARLAIEQPGDFESDGGRDQGVQGGVGMLQGEGVGVGEVGGELEEEFGGEVEEGGARWGRAGCGSHGHWMCALK